MLNQALVTSPALARTWFLSENGGETGTSTQMAEALAARIREQAQVDVGIAVVGDTDPDVGPYSERTGDTYIGLSTHDGSTGRHIRIGGVTEVARTWVTNTTLDLLRRHLLGLLG